MLDGPLAYLLEEADGGGGGYVERFDLAQMRDHHFLGCQRRQCGRDALPFMTEQPGDRLRQVALIDGLRRMRTGRQYRHAATGTKRHEVGVLEDIEHEMRAH